MVNTIELIKPWQGGVIAFFFVFLIIIAFGNLMDKQMVYVILLAILVGLGMGISVTFRMYRFRIRTITVSFTNNEEFMKKLNTALFQIKYTLESNKENFFIYKMDILSGRSKIAVTIDQKEATIVGPKLYVEKLQKAFLE